MPQQDRPGPPFNDRAEYEQAVRLAAARQRIAHENTGLPAWDDLPPEDQRPGVVAALHYLRAYQLAGLDHQLDHRDAAAPSEFALESVRRACNACTGLHGTTVVLEAARLLDDLAATAERHGHDLDIAIAGLASYAADTVTSRYDRPKPERSVDEVNALLRHLADAFTDAGLTTTACEVRAGVAVAPIPGVRAWGPDRTTGLAVSIFLDSGWELTVNRPGAPLTSIYAPATREGARDVATIVRDVLHGVIPDPFRPRGW
ncbi:hypothetical protein ACFFR3_45805 [Nonomuraea salmonea]|uniref:Uncharacterized protein n=1 Tax=Nonomuraea salmonea TaxID=46181 RepID=A0ABV5P3X2_9ACTN